MSFDLTTLYFYGIQRGVFSVGLVLARSKDKFNFVAGVSRAHGEIDE